MRIALLELPARFDARAEALADAAGLLAGGPRVDLALFSELALTGYVSPSGDFDLASLAEPVDGPSLAGARELARSSGAHVAFPLVERDGAALYNAFGVVAPDGAPVLRYRKRHPWFPERWATPGDGPVAEFTLAGVRLALAICYDVHFLADESADALERADVLLFPSAWVDLGTTRDLRAPIFAELARSFDLVVANANWGPGAPRIGGQGTSRFVGPRGEISRAAFAPRAEARPTAQRLDLVIEV